MEKTMPFVLLHRLWHRMDEATSSSSKSHIYETPSEQNGKNMILKWWQIQIWPLTELLSVASLSLSFSLYLMYNQWFLHKDQDEPWIPVASVKLNLAQLLFSKLIVPTVPSSLFASRLHSLKSLYFASLPALSPLNSISEPPKEICTDGQRPHCN